jgi:threonine dehydratase
VIKGQATAALELCEEVEGLDAVVAPVGGGGLLSGTATVVAALRPDAATYGAEPSAVDDAQRSFRAGKILPSGNSTSIADGLLKTLGNRNFEIIKRFVRDIVTVSEEEIIAATKLMWERMKIVIEPSAAVPVAALLQRRISGHKRIGVILSGGNVDLAKLPW